MAQLLPFFDARVIETLVGSLIGDGGWITISSMHLTKCAAIANDSYQVKFGGYATCAVNFTPSARAAFSTVSNLGFAPGAKAL